MALPEIPGGLPSITGGPGGSAGPSSAYGGKTDAIFDSSGWQVVFGNGNELASSKAGDLAQYLPYVMAGAAVLIVWRMTRKR